VIVGNQGFVTVAKTSGSGTVLHALDSATGQDVWTADLGGTYYVGALTYGGGSLFALNYNGVLTAFNPASGAVLWTEQLPGQYEFSAAPTYANCTVYIGGAGSGGTLYAVDGATGNITWRQSVMNGDGSSPAVNASGVLVSYACQQDYAFDPTAGTLIWNHSTACEGGGGSTPTLGGGSVWLSGFLDPQMALNPADGSPSKAKVPNAWTGTPAFDGTHGFFLENGVLTAQDTDHSKPRWTFSGDGNLSSMPIVVNGYVYIASTSGQVWAVDETTGAVAWTGNVGAPVLGDDSMNVDRPLSGLAAGQGLVVVPASTKLVAFGN
jgi:outer membrane protein assembly factor BamB